MYGVSKIKFILISAQKQ